MCLQFAWRETERPDARAMPDNPPPFRCPICRCSQYEVVSVATPRGEIRRTPFYACCGCTVMFRDPVAFTRFDPTRVTAGRTTGAAHQH